MSPEVEKLTNNFVESIMQIADRMKEDLFKSLGVNPETGRLIPKEGEALLTFNGTHFILTSGDRTWRSKRRREMLQVARTKGLTLLEPT